MKCSADNMNNVISENMEYHQKTFKQNHCPVNSLEQNLILTGLKDQKKLLTDLINMIDFNQERKNSCVNY